MAIESIEKLRKRQEKRMLVRRILILLLAIAVVFFMYRQRFEIASAGLSVWLEEKLWAYMPTNNFPINLPTDKDKQIFKAGSRIGVLQNHGINVYNGAGDWLMDIRTAYQNPVVVANAKRMIVYDSGAVPLRQYINDNLVYDKDFEYPISAVSMSSNGKMAVTTGEARYQSKVEVFSKDFQSIFVWYSADNLIVETALNEKSLVTSGIYTKDGMLCSEITWLSLSSDQAKSSLIVEDELVFYLEFLDDTTIMAITNKSAAIISKSGEVINKTNFVDKIESFNINNGKLWVVRGDYSKTHKMEIVVYDTKLKEEGVIPVEQYISSLSSYGNSTVALSENYAYIYNSKRELIHTVSTPNAVSAVVSGGYLYYLTQNSMHRVQLRNTRQGSGL